MFGNKKRISQEEYDRIQSSLERGGQIIGQLSEKKGAMDAVFSETRESRKQMRVDLKQVSDNLKSVTESAQQNVESAASLTHTLEEHRNALQQSEREYTGICDKLEQQMQEAEQLVEENKHFTSPSKYLNELPAELKEQQKQALQSLEEMGEYGRQMSVLALNAAIEAGRMGEYGRQFVSAAEDVRTYAMKYEASARNLKTEIMGQDKRISELEETVHHLVSLLKENNLSTAKLMRSCQNNLKHARQSPAMRALSEDVPAMKEQLGGIRSVQEEIIKSGERNRLQLGDIEEEISTQEKSLQEVEDTMTSLFTAAKHYRPR